MKTTLLLSIISLVLFSSSPAFGQTWAGALNGTTESWNVNANWSPATFPNAIGASANLNVDFTANKIISLQQAITVGSLTLGDSSGISTLTLNSGTGTNALTFDASSGNATLTTSGGSNAISANAVFTDSVDLSNSSTLTLSGTISGAGTLNKLATAGSVTISGSNTGWSGGINLRQSTINIGGSANAVLGTGDFTFANLTGGSGNTLAFNAANSRTISNNFINNNAAAVSGTQFAQISFSGGVTGNRVQTFTGTFSTGGSYFTGTNPQALVLEAQGSTTADEGTIVLQGSWAGYNGGAGNASAIRIGANSSGDGGTVLIDSAASSANTGGYQIQGNGTTVGTKLILNGAFTMANNVSFAGAAGGAMSSFGSRNAVSTSATLSGNLSMSDSDGGNLFSQATGAKLVVSGIISGSNPLEINRSYTFTSANGTNTTETPAGTVQLSNASNTYTGATTITAGTLSVGTIGNGGVAGNLGQATNAATNIVFNGGTLQYTGANATSDRAFTINAGKTATIDTANNLTLAGATGAATNGALSKTGAGTLTLTAASTNTGSTTISGGALQLGNGGTSGALSISSVIVNDANLTINRSNAVTQGTDFSGSAITGTGSVTQAGSGTTTLNAANTYSGGTTVTSGTLEVNNTTGSGTGSGTATVNGKLAGEGSITASAGNFVFLNGTLQVGSSAATQGTDFSITTSGGGSTVLGSSSITSFDIWNSASGNQSGNLAAADMLRIFGDFSITGGASLVLGNPDSRSFMAGDVFRLFDWSGLSTLTGTYSSVDSSSLALGGLLLDTSNLYTTTGALAGTISIMGIPEPSRALLFMLGFTALVTRRRRA